jgi:hypothetical protein
MTYSNRSFAFAQDDEEKIKNQSVPLSSAFADASDFACATPDKSADKSARRMADKCRQWINNPP